jgi:hypothetical protein
LREPAIGPVVTVCGAANFGISFKGRLLPWAEKRGGEAGGLLVEVDHVPSPA